MRSTRLLIGVLIVGMLWASIAGTALEAYRIAKFDGKLIKFEESPMKGPPSDNPNAGKKPPKGPKEPESNKWAVVIGIADYQGRNSDLWHPDEDAKEMARVLEEKYGYTNVKLITNRKATARAIVEAIDWLVANTNETSQAVFFYSGHGFRAADSENWDSDTETDGYDEGIVTYDFYGLPDGWLAGKFDNFPTAYFSLFFGSCHSGGMFDDNDDIGYEGSSDSLTIASACKADQYGWDYLSLGNTLWGYYFVDEGMMQGLADLGDGVVSVEEAHAYAGPRVVEEQPDSEPQLLDHTDGERIP